MDSSPAIDSPSEGPGIAKITNERDSRSKQKNITILTLIPVALEGCELGFWEVQKHLYNRQIHSRLANMDYMFGSGWFLMLLLRCISSLHKRFFRVLDIQHCSPNADMSSSKALHCSLSKELCVFQLNMVNKPDLSTLILYSIAGAIHLTPIFLMPTERAYCLTQPPTRDT